MNRGRRGEDLFADIKAVSTLPFQCQAIIIVQLYLKANGFSQAHGKRTVIPVQRISIRH
jgi:hypothetical protein